jgi:hypothetical protein
MTGPWLAPRARTLDRRSSAHPLGAQPARADDPQMTPPRAVRS